MGSMVKYILGDTMNEYFISLLHDLDLELSERQWNQFHTYYDLLLEWNAQMNLTSITDQDEVFLKHFYDSLCLLKARPLSDQTLLDVGSGAGFPSVPLKIMFPALRVTIIDALQKRIRFLETLVDRLDIDVELIHGRAEEHPRKNHYDLVTARAVAALPVLSELCVPFVRPGGSFLAMKGPNYQDEIKLMKHGLDLMNAELKGVLEYEVGDYARSIIMVRKIAPSSGKYPRKFSKIKSKPL